MKSEKIKKIVKNSYSAIAKSGSGCGCGCKNNRDISRSIGYSEKEIDSLSEANLGLGCGNPVALGRINDGDVVLDLGSGAGFDAFLAAKKTGSNGKVIGVDMTEEMINKARENADKYNCSNVEFRLGDIENLPIEEAAVDVIISNCVINLTPDKQKAFSEAYRALKPGGRMYVSDIVLLEELTAEQRDDKELIAGCVAGAQLKEEYLRAIQQAGFKIKILGENKSISKEQYNGIPLQSISIEAIKPNF